MVGEILITGAKLVSALSGSPDSTAYETENISLDSTAVKKSYEFKTSNEIDGYSNGLGTNLNYRRSSYSLENLSFTIDKKYGIGAKDLVEIAVSDPFGVPIGRIAVLQKGNKDEKKQYIWQATKVFSRKNKDGSVILDVGQFLESGDNPEMSWIYVAGEDKDKYIMFSLFNPNKGVKKTGIPNTAFGVVGHKISNHLYGEVAGAVNVGKDGLEGTRKIITFGTLDRKNLGAVGIRVADVDSKGNRTGFYKTKFALGNVDQKFYNKNLYNFTSNLFTFAPFFPPFFPQTSTKGDFTVGVDGSQIHDKKTRETLVGLRTKYGAFSAGTYMEKQKGENKKRNAVIAYHKGWKIGNKDSPLNFSVELKYDKNRELSGHITTSKSMKFPRRR